MTEFEYSTRRVDYFATVMGLRRFCDAHETEAADLGSGRRFYVTNLPSDKKPDKEGWSGHLLLCVGQVRVGDDERYGVDLIEYEVVLEQGHRYEKEQGRTAVKYSACPGDEEINGHSRTDGEDLRRRLGAIVGCDVLEAWYQVGDDDPSPVVQAAMESDRCALERFEAWQRQNSGGPATGTD